jgi:hypothetical protein
MQPNADPWCPECLMKHDICEVCGAYIVACLRIHRKMNAHGNGVHYCLESPEYAMRTRALAEHYARQERQMISDCLRCPGKLVFRYAGDPTLYDYVAGQFVHNCDTPAQPEPTPIRPPIKEEDRPATQPPLPGSSQPWRLIP